MLTRLVVAIILSMVGHTSVLGEPLPSNAGKVERSDGASKKSDQVKPEITEDRRKRKSERSARISKIRRLEGLSSFR
jgi:hypothetical protein